MAKRKSMVSQKGVMYNQFFGMMLVALGVGALVVVVRYMVVASQVPTEIFEISPSLLIPGINN